MTVLLDAGVLTGFAMCVSCSLELAVGSYEVCERDVRVAIAGLGIGLVVAHVVDSLLGTRVDAGVAVGAGAVVVDRVTVLDANARVIARFEVF